ncbi:MAG: glycoside hydrolase [Lentimicrobium sp.]|nr:glycoside hydrolase [Lentimicrobium sp.]
MKIERTVFLMLMLVAFHGAGQNTIDNPGFENGMNYWNFWLRDAGMGSVQTVSTPVHSGLAALQILHWGSNDWSLRPNADFEVNPGEIYQFSAWVQAEQLSDYAEMSFALFDAAGNAIDWSYNPSKITVQPGFTQYTTNIAIPGNVATLSPRFIGNDSCTLFIDDVSFSLTGQLPATKIHHLENEALSVDITSPSLGISVLEKISNTSYNFGSGEVFDVSEIDSTEATFTFHTNLVASGFPLTIQISLSGNALKFELQNENNDPFLHDLNFPGPIESRTGDYIIIPLASGILLPVEEEYPFWDFRLYNWKATMAFTGITNLNTGYMMATDDPWDTQIEFPKGANNLTTFSLIHEPSKGTLGYTRKFSYIFFSGGGYLPMTQWYREYAASKNYIKTFDQKIAENPNVEKLKGAVDFWALDWHFRQPEFIDSLYHFGIDKALVSLTGSWGNFYNFNEVIDTINNRGMLSSRYDIFTDVWPPLNPPIPAYRSEGYPEDVVVQQDGSLLEGWLAHLEDGTPYQGYYTCASTHPEYARQWIPVDLATNPYNARFIDVELASSLVECYSPDHPVTRYEDGLNRTALLNVVKNEYNLVTGSEEARDFAFPVVDFGEGTMSIIPPEGAGNDWTTPIDNPGENYIAYNMNAALRIPLHGLVYHDVHVPTWYTGDGLSKVPAFWDEKVLFNVLYASMPLVAPPDYEYWQANRERFLTSMIMTSAVSRSCGFAPMTSHAFLSANRLVQQTHFSNDWTVIANFDIQPFQWNQTLLPKNGFWAGNNSNKYVSRNISENAEVQTAKLNDRFFINPGGTEYTSMGIRSTGSVLIKNTDQFLNLSFIGPQEVIDLNPMLLPWPMNDIAAADLHNGEPVPLSYLGNGWYRLYKTDNHLFYRIDGEFTVETAQLDKAVDFLLSPNPAAGNFTVQFNLAAAGSIKLTVFNMYGQPILTISETTLSAGTHTIPCATQLTAGLYLIQLEANGAERMKKLVIRP